MGVKVRQRPKGSGIWWVFIDHHGLRKAKKCGSQKLANKVAEIMKSNLTLGRPLLGEEEKPPLPTLKQYYEQFKEAYMETTLKPSTFKSYEMSFRVHILPALGNYRLDQIDRTRMEEFVAGLVKKKISEESERTLSKDSIRLIIAALGILYSEALEKKIVQENPTKALGKFYRQAPKRHEEIEPLTEAESILLLQTGLEQYPAHYPLFLCALHTGMRSGEIAGLQWSDIDWHGKFISVRRSIVGGQITTVKTKNGRRHVDISDELLTTLGDLRKWRQEEGLKKGKNEIPEWVFANEKGGFADMHNLKARYFKKVLRKAGIRDIRFHDLRHSYASLLLANGEPVTYVSKQLGHANPKITFEIYAHWIPNESQRQAVNRLPSLGMIAAKEAIN